MNKFFKFFLLYHRSYMSPFNISECFVWRRYFFYIILGYSISAGIINISFYKINRHLILHFVLDREFTRIEVFFIKSIIHNSSVISLRIFKQYLIKISKRIIRVEYKGFSHIYITVIYALLRNI